MFCDCCDGNLTVTFRTVVIRTVFANGSLHSILLDTVRLCRHLNFFNKSFCIRLPNEYFFMVYFCRWLSVHVRTITISTISVSHFAALVMLLQVVATNFLAFICISILKTLFIILMLKMHNSRVMSNRFLIFSLAQHFARQGTSIT